MQQLRNRPFLVITFSQRPHSLVNTSTKGWSEDGGKWDVNEGMVIVDRVNNNMLLTSHVVLDLLNVKVVKSRFEEPEQDVYRAYFTRYKDDILEALKLWGLKSPDNLMQLRNVADMFKEPEIGEQANTD